jgi:LysM repeat protein
MPLLIAALAMVLLTMAGCNRPDQGVALDTPVPSAPQAQATLPPATQPTLPPVVTSAPEEPDLNATMNAAAGSPTAEATPAGVGEATALPPAAAPATSTPEAPAVQPAQATAAPQPTAAASSSGPTVHTVQSGERLFSIARLYNVNPYAIAQLNGISAPYLIYPGQKLKIPGTGPSATPVPNQTPVPGGSTYTVQPGDNLFRIALKFGKSMQAIAAANNISNYNFIYVGQVLKIP